MLLENKAMRYQAIKLVSQKMEDGLTREDAEEAVSTEFAKRFGGFTQGLLNLFDPQKDDYYAAYSQRDPRPKQY